MGVVEIIFIIIIVIVLVAVVLLSLRPNSNRAPVINFSNGVVTIKNENNNNLYCIVNIKDQDNEEFNFERTIDSNESLLIECSKNEYFVKGNKYELNASFNNGPISTINFTF